MTTALVFDVGGTSTRAAIYDASTGRLLADDRRPTPNRAANPGARISQLIDHLLDLMTEQATKVSGGNIPAHVGIAFAGPVSDGKVLRAPTIWGDHAGAPVPMRDLVAERWPGRHLHVCNDVTAAGYRYLRTRFDDFCIITVSSGIGHKLFVGGRPAVGPHGRGGEIGHLRIDYSRNAPTCECGGRGHLSAVTCGRASGYQTRRLIERGEVALHDVEAFYQAGEVDNKRLANAFRSGFPGARRVVEEMAAPLGACLGMLHLATGFERVCVIGGLGLALGRGYLELLARAAAESGWDTGLDWRTVLELGEPDDDAALIGLGRALAWGLPEAS
jgi:predicted NBD/HSP70 family sugar kinase